MVRRGLRWLILIIVLGVGIASAVYFGAIRANYPTLSDFPIRGIDLSHHQGSIDWQALKSEDFSFVFLKATEGIDFVDPDFNSNWLELERSGYLAAPYHFYLICRPGLPQAEHFIRTALVHKTPLPPVIDLEFVGYCEEVPPVEIVIEEIRVCVDRVAAHCGRPPILYVTKDFYSTYLIGGFKECPLWIRDIVGKPQLPDDRDWTFWQYANRGHAVGIEGFVDLNVFQGDSSDFQSFIHGTKREQETR